MSFSSPEKMLKKCNRHWAFWGLLTQYWSSKAEVMDQMRLHETHLFFYLGNACFELLVATQVKIKPDLELRVEENGFHSWKGEETSTRRAVLCISLCLFALGLVDSKEEFLSVLVHPDTKGFPVSSPLLKNDPASTRVLIHSSLEEQWTSISRHCEEYRLVQMIVFAFAYQRAAGQGQSCYTLAELPHSWEKLRAIKWPRIQLEVPSLTTTLAEGWPDSLSPDSNQNSFHAACAGCLPSALHTGFLAA